MAWESLHGPIKLNTKGSIKIIKNMDSAHYFSKMEVFIKAIGKRENQMGRENTFLKREINEEGHGRTARLLNGMKNTITKRPIRR